MGLASDSRLPPTLLLKGCSLRTAEGTEQIYPHLLSSNPTTFALPSLLLSSTLLRWRRRTGVVSFGSAATTAAQLRLCSFWLSLVYLVDHICDFVCLPRTTLVRWSTRQLAHACSTDPTYHCYPALSHTRPDTNGEVDAAARSTTSDSEHIMAMQLETATSPFPDASLDQDDVVYPCKGCGEVCQLPYIRSRAGCRL